MSKFEALALPVDNAARMIIVHPIDGTPLRDSEGNEAWIELLSSDSSDADKQDRKAINRRLARRVKAALTAEELRGATAERLATQTVAWNLMAPARNERGDIVSGHAVPLNVPYSKADAVELYLERSMSWLREQVEEFVEDRKNFTKSSSKS